MGPSQVIYSLLALTIVGILGFSVSRGLMSVGQRAYQNETLTQVSGVANEILEDIGSRAFDANTISSVPGSVSELTAVAGFGGGCDPEVSCIDIDDFDGKTLYREREGLDFTVDVRVEYVDQDDPTLVSSTPTFAKQVTLSITTPYVYKENNPDSLITMQMSRVFTYNRTTG